VKLLFVASELAPLAQTGGLGDAVAGLAAALVARGHAVTCVLPAYRSLLAHPECPALASEPGPQLSGVPGPLRWLRGTLESGAGLCLFDAPGLYTGDQLYGEPDQQVLRFASLARAAASLAVEECPDVLVAHDWHAALAPACLRTIFDAGPGRAVATVQVIHNNAHQGRFQASAMAQTGLPAELFQPEGLEFFGDLCLLKGGLLFADRIVAVSPQYAEELRTPAQGNGLEGVYNSRAHLLYGIANGIDTQRYDPSTDAELPARFSALEIEGRAQCRKALLQQLRLDVPASGLFLTAIGRFAEQKGWDVLADALPHLVAAGASIALLGDGDAEISTRLRAAANRASQRIHLSIGWNEPMARRLYGGADAVLVPSRFEPCGLVQLLAQRYGCLPIAHRVGGLVDTIRDGETGVLFSPLSTRELVKATLRGAALVAQRGEAALSQDLASLDVSWTEPARLWETLLLAAAEEARVRAGG